jgi:hypothetical protein
LNSAVRRWKTENPRLSIHRSFTPIDTVPGVGGASLAMRWQHDLQGIAALRVLAQVDGRNTLLYTPARAQTLNIVVPPQLPSIVLDQVPPVSGIVNLSLDDRVAYRSVEWFSNSNLIGETKSQPGAFLAWYTNQYGVNDASNALTARVETATDSRVGLHLDVAVHNGALDTSYTLWADPTSTYVDIQAYAFGRQIASVEGSLDGGAETVLNAPNACDPEIGCGPDGPNLFEFSFDNAAHLGHHVLEVTASDVVGNSQQLGVPFDGTDAGDCLDVCIYAWAPDNTRTNISANDPVPGPHRSPVAHDGAIAWVDQTSPYTDTTLRVYQLASGAYLSLSATTCTATGRAWRGSPPTASTRRRSPAVRSMRWSTAATRSRWSPETA